LLVVATIAFMMMSSSSAFADNTKTIYDSLKIAPNVPSEGPEAYAFAEFGDEVTFAGTARSLDRVTVTLSSWACQTGTWYAQTCQSARGATFTIPITLKIYAPSGSNTAGALLATQTRTFTVPYRPSSDTARCGDGRWFASTALGCFNGIEWLVTFDFASEHITLPNTVVYGVAYNSTHYGPNPVGESATCYTSSGGCPYDSLNIGLAPKVNVGSKPHPDTIYQNSSLGAEYCDGGVAGVGTMRLDSPTIACWAGYVPAVRFTASGGRGNNQDGDDNSGNNDDSGNGNHDSQN
jgi:hypothetical protein